jgi:predicted dehydrogenase
MGEADNETTGQQSLRVGLIADAQSLASLAQAATACPMQVVAQAGTRQPESLPGVEWYDDTRVMIAQSGVEAVLLSTSVRAGVQLGKTAVEHGVHVWRRPPLGRSFAEAAEVVRLAQASAPVYRVASWWDHVAEDVGDATGRCEGYKPRFSEIRVSAPGPSMQSWRASAVDAGGGVLTAEAYDLLDALIALRQLPESLSAAIGNYRHKAGEARRETEDVAAAILRYHDGGTAVIRASWDIPPFQRVAHHHGVEATVVLDECGVALRSAEGEMRHERRWPADVPVGELRRFVATVQSANQQPPADPTLDRHLAISALLEAIYLSARTGQPEIPGRLYEVQGWREPRL